MVKVIKFAITVSIMLCANCSITSQTDVGAGSRSIALGQTGLGFSDINAAYTNPSGLHGLQAFAIHTGITRPFGVRELSRVQMAVAGKVSKSGFMFGTVDSKGISGFRQTRVSSGYGRKMTSTMSVAIEFETLLLSVRGYGNAIALGYGISMWHQPFKQLIIGAHLRNPVRISEEGAIVAKSTLAFGFSYLASKLVTINAECFKDTQFKLRIKSGVEYHVHPVFTLRAGATTNPAQLYFGFAWIFEENLVVDLSVGYHTALGITPSIGVAYAKSSGDNVRKGSKYRH